MPEQKGDKPIPGPQSVGQEHILDPDPQALNGPMARVALRILGWLRFPGDWARANIVEPNRGEKYYWYHRKYGRVLPIDECYLDDYACMHEANLEYQRNFLVDRETLEILRFRRDNCHYWNLTTKNINFISDNCKEISDQYDREEINFFIKYGELHDKSSVIHAYNKQKHRMIMERRRAQKSKNQLPEETA